MTDSIWIVGCGDIGQRVAKLYPEEQRNSLYGIVQSNESAIACKRIGINTHQLNFDQKVQLPIIDSSHIYYFMPPPSTGREDTRLEYFLNSLNSSATTTQKRIVLISTTGVYGDSQGAWIDEDCPVNPIADRAYRRLSAETLLKKWAKQTGGEYIILRVPGIYAEDRLPLARLKKGLPIVNKKEAGWTNRIHADDLAQACIAAMNCPQRNEVINICDGNPSTMTDYFNQIADYANLPRPPQISMAQAEKELSSGMVSYLKESRKIRNNKMLSLLKIKLNYPDLASFIKKGDKESTLSPLRALY